LDATNEINEKGKELHTMRSVIGFMLLVGVISWVGCEEAANHTTLTPDYFVFDGSNLKEETIASGKKIHTLPPNSDLVLTYSLGLADTEVTANLFTLKELPGSRLITIVGQQPVIAPVIVGIEFDV
jgi:hypothetical protein